MHSEMGLPISTFDSQAQWGIPQVLKDNLLPSPQIGLLAECPGKQLQGPK